MWIKLLKLYTGETEFNVFEIVWIYNTEWFSAQWYGVASFMPGIKINEIGGGLIYVESAGFEFIYSVMLDWLKTSGIGLYIAWNRIESMESTFMDLLVPLR